jgi:hypothetical protein
VEELEVMPSKKPVAFLVFKQMLDLPDGSNIATLLHDPNTPLAIKRELYRSINHSVGVLDSEALRNTQQERWTAANALRAAVMVDYVPGKRGEAARLRERAAKIKGTDVPMRTVRGWIEDLKKPAKTSPAPVGKTWKAVIEGQMVSRQKRDAARSRKKLP